MDNNYAWRIALLVMLWAGIGNRNYAVAQDGQPTIQPDVSGKKWAFDASANMYVTGSNNFVNPVVTADRDWLHLEGRYNYENFSTGSLWAGYNFSVGEKWTLDATPMIGYVFGRTNAIGPGIGFTLSHKKFEWYSEGEWIFDLDSKENNYTYFWSDFSYYIKDWWWAGFSVQRTRLYQSSYEMQRGLLTGVAYKNLYLTSYFFNPFSSDFYTVLSAGITF